MVESADWKASLTRQRTKWCAQAPLFAHDSIAAVGQHRRLQLCPIPLNFGGEPIVLQERHLRECWQVAQHRVQHDCPAPVLSRG